MMSVLPFQKPGHRHEPPKRENALKKDSRLNKKYPYYK